MIVVLILCVCGFCNLVDIQKGWCVIEVSVMLKIDYVCFFGMI